MCGSPSDSVIRPITITGSESIGTIDFSDTIMAYQTSGLSACATGFRTSAIDCATVTTTTFRTALLTTATAFTTAVSITG